MMPTDETCGITATLTTRSFTIGDGTCYVWAGQIGGLGQTIRNNDVVKGHADGSTAQLDYRNPRNITFPIQIGKTFSGSTMTPVIRTKADIWDAFETLEAGWDLSQIDIPIELNLDSHIRTFLGRPRDMTVDTSDMTKGKPRLRVTLLFVANDPTVY
jgi:hypothetical protein